MLLTARFVVPVDAPVIENGAVLIRNGRIAAVGTAKHLGGRAETDFGDVVVCPGFVNAHTHLELSHLAGRIPPRGHLTDWLLRLMETLRDEPPAVETVERAVRDGIRQSIRSGVTCVGDITRSPAWTRRVLAEARICGVSFGEVGAIGAGRHLLEPRLEAAVSSQFATARLRIGLSPHSPYTVEPPALRRCAQRASERNLPLCIHLAETAEEEQFTVNAVGPLAVYLKNLGIWDDDVQPHGVRPVEAARVAGVLGPRTVLAHGNYIAADDFPVLVRSGTSVAVCPRTHRAFKHAPHPFRQMLHAGVNVCIGTDSLASSPSLSILDEVRFLRRAHRDLDPEVLVRMGSLHGARALGRADTLGSLTPGKRADLVVLPISATARAWTEILERDDPPCAVYVGGDRPSLD